MRSWVSEARFRSWSIPVVAGAMNGIVVRFDIGFGDRSSLILYEPS